jgi:hypothetical protein
VTRLLDPPSAVEVDEGGRPRHVRRIERWVVEVDWWTGEPVSREYWLAVLRDRLLCEIYRDPIDGAWYLERVYD